jgi:hypothetical protein
MTAGRLTAWLLSALLMVAPVIGFAAGDPALQIWNEHPRHAPSQLAAPHVLAKMAPAAVAPSAPVLVLMVAAAGLFDPPAVTASARPRPPFVPPRA